jgi:hypothetical protein
MSLSKLNTGDLDYLGEEKAGFLRSLGMVNGG